jgi:hypothetical protein
VATSSPISERFEKLLHDVRCSSRVLIVSGGRPLVGADLDEKRRLWGCQLRGAGAGPGEVMGMEAPLSVDAVALLLAILAKGCIAAVVPPGDAGNDAALRGAGAVHGWRQAENGQWTLEERLPPFGPASGELPPAPGLLLAGKRSGSFETALGLESLLRSLEKSRRARPAPAPLHTREGVTALFAALRRGAPLVLPATSTRPAPAPSSRD